MEVVRGDVMKKILVSDYDDTLYINSEGIKKNLIAIEALRKKGNLFVIATGRSYDDFKVKKDKYGIQYDYLILNHGATILKDDKIIFNQIIENEVVGKIKHDLKLVDNDNLFCCSAKESRVSINHKDITKIHIAFNDKNLAQKYKKLLDENYRTQINTYYISANMAIEIISKKTNKAIAIEKIRNQEKIEKNNIYVIGNGSSDVEMIRTFNGCAVTSAIPEVLEISNKRYQSVEQLVKEMLDETPN